MTCRASVCALFQVWVLPLSRNPHQVKQRLLRGETIPHDEKAFSIFENHTRWISKGKSGHPVELGVPACVLEDQYGFLLHYEILWEGGDTDIALPMIEAAQARYPNLRACSFDRGSTAPQTASASMPCSSTTCCPGRGARAGSGVSAMRTRRSSQRAGSTRRSNLRSTTCSTAPHQPGTLEGRNPRTALDATAHITPLLW